MVIELPKLPRSFVQTVECPNCHAGPGVSCMGARDKPRESNHAERVYAADAKRNGQQEREHRYYDDERPIAYTGPAVHPTIGRKVAYDACVGELMKRKGMNRADAEKRARELLRMWLPEERREIA